MDVYEIEGKRPKIDPDVAFIADDVKIIGDVEIGKGCTIFNGVVLEGFPIKIKIGECTNIQAGTIVHGLQGVDTTIGDYNTIGHRCIIHGCTLERNVTIGIGSTIMGHTKIKENSFVAAGSLVTQRKTFPKNSFILGSPAKKVRDIKAEEAKEALNIAKMYRDEGIILKNNLKKI